MMKRRYMIPLLILVVLGIAYWAGPRLPRTELNTDLQGGSVTGEAR